MTVCYGVPVGRQCGERVGRGASVRLLFGREVALRNWGYAEARGGTYMYTWKVMFSLFCCVVILVGHGVWWVITLCGVKRFGWGGTLLILVEV